jgi:hypothetical protein
VILPPLVFPALLDYESAHRVVPLTLCVTNKH